jgi:3-(3-hydroxy-phenyl)propionate hydroxylase
MTGVETIRADYLIGADGANSIVRKWLGIDFDGFTYQERFLTLSTQIELADYLPNLAYVNYVSDPPNGWCCCACPRCGGAGAHRCGDGR